MEKVGSSRPDLPHTMIQRDCSTSPRHQCYRTGRDHRALLPHRLIRMCTSIALLNTAKGRRLHIQRPTRRLPHFVSLASRCIPSGRPTSLRIAVVTSSPRFLATSIVQGNPSHIFRHSGLSTTMSRQAPGTTFRFMPAITISPSPTCIGCRPILRTNQRWAGSGAASVSPAICRT